MKLAIAAALAACALIPSFAQASQKPDPTGVWLRDDGNARVRIARCGSNICATNLWIRDESSGEAAGDKLIMTLSPKSANSLTGKAFDPKRNLTYSITVTVSKKSLTTRGCVIGGLLCRNVGWKAAK